jgi:hypothetical protein
MDLATKKKKLIHWIDSIKDEDLLNQLERFSQESPFNFGKEIENSISEAELKSRTTYFLENLDWKKS